MFSLTILRRQTLHYSCSALRCSRALFRRSGELNCSYPFTQALKTAKGMSDGFTLSLSLMVPLFLEQPNGVPSEDSLSLHWPDWIAWDHQRRERLDYTNSISERCERTHSR